MFEIVLFLPQKLTIRLKKPPRSFNTAVIRLYMCIFLFADVVNFHFARSVSLINTRCIENICARTAVNARISYSASVLCKLVGRDHELSAFKCTRKLYKSFRHSRDITTHPGALKKRVVVVAAAGSTTVALPLSLPPSLPPPSPADDAILTTRAQGVRCYVSVSADTDF